MVSETGMVLTVKTALILKVRQFNNILALVCLILRLACVKIIRNNERLRHHLICSGNEGIFGHVTTFWIFTHVDIVLIATAAKHSNDKLARAAPIPLFTNTSNTKYSAEKYPQVQVPIPSTLK